MHRGLGEHVVFHACINVLMILLRLILVIEKRFILNIMLSAIHLLVFLLPHMHNKYLCD